MLDGVRTAHPYNRCTQMVFLLIQKFIILVPTKDPNVCERIHYRITIGAYKKSLGNSAVERNRAKRRVQEACRNVLLEEWQKKNGGKEHFLPFKFDIMCVIYPGCLIAPFEILKQQWRDTFLHLQQCRNKY
jgi:ribonuclease P protein component